MFNLLQGISTGGLSLFSRLNCTVLQSQESCNRQEEVMFLYRMVTQHQLLWLHLLVTLLTCILVPPFFLQIGLTCADYLCGTPEACLPHATKGAQPDYKRGADLLVAIYTFESGCAC